MKNFINRYRYSIVLLKQLVKTDFKLRYQGSVLGYVWSLLKPLALFCILYVVFAKFLRFEGTIPNYPIYLLLGIVFWNYFVEVTAGSVRLIVEKGDLIRKINFPKYVIVLSGSFSALINLAFNFVVVAVFMVLNEIDIRTAIVFLPLVLLQLFVFSLACSFFLSAAYVRFRDVSHIWDVLIQGAFYATPILYPLSLVPDFAAKILMMNPMAQIIQDARFVLITPETETVTKVFGNYQYHSIPILMTLIIAVVASFYFRKRSKYFAENV